MQGPATIARDEGLRHAFTSDEQASAAETPFKESLAVLHESKLTSPSQIWFMTWEHYKGQVV